MKSIKLVEEFHKAFGHAIAKTPQTPDVQDHNFRIRFIEEELVETNMAGLHNDVVAYADGLGDIQYVLDGWFLNAGLLEYKDAIMAEIHRSNMTKRCKTEKEANDLINELHRKYERENPISIDTLEQPIYDKKEINGYWIVYRISDGKSQKSVNYEKPNLANVLDTAPSSINDDDLARCEESFVIRMKSGYIKWNSAKFRIAQAEYFTGCMVALDIVPPSWYFPILRGAPIVQEYKL